MNILINASLPGCGKTYLLTNLFKEYQPKPYEKVVFITKANKALDNARFMGCTNKSSFIETSNVLWC